MAEAKLLRQHKGRLEARMQILEDHNRQLEAQLQRLRQLLDEVSVFCDEFLLLIVYFLSFTKKSSQIHPKHPHCKHGLLRHRNSIRNHQLNSNKMVITIRIQVSSNKHNGIYLLMVHLNFRLAKKSPTEFFFTNPKVNFSLLINIFW